VKTPRPLQFEGTVTRIDGGRVAIVVVPSDVVNDPVQAGKTLASFQDTVFKGTMTVLLGRDGPGGDAKFFGEPNLVAKLVKIDTRRFKWQRYTFKHTGR
jgi:hypothetical protein